MVHDSFFAHFNTYLYSLISDLPSLLLATRSVLQAFQDDGVLYLELRTTPRAIGSHDAEATIRAILGIINQWNAVESMTVSLILSIDQAKHSPETAINIVNLAATLRTEAHPVVGVDLCGDPNRAADPITFRPAFKLAKEKGLGIVLHFAEVPNTSSPEILSEMLSWHPDRLGHVIHVPPAVRRTIIQRNIGVELCLTCNVLAGMLPSRGSFQEHHFPDWWRGSDAPKVSLGTDDVGVFGSMSSEEHLLAAQHFGLSRLDLVKLAQSALSTALGDVGAARQAIDRFERGFATFEGNAK